MNIENHLKALGFKNERLSHQFQHDKIQYYVVYLNDDSYGFPIWLIENTRHVETVFRGRILNGSEFDMILMRVMEDYELNDSEIGFLKTTKNT